MAAFSTIALITAIAGTGLQAYGQVKAGKAAKEAGKADRAAAESQAQLADFNAMVADLQASDAIDRGREAENLYRSSVKQMIGSQRAGLAASGVDVNYGSAVDVQADAAFLGEMDALTISNNAARESWGYKVQATDLRKRAEIARKEGVYLEKAGNSAGNQAYLGAAGSILGGTTSLLQSRYGFNTKTRTA